MKPNPMAPPAIWAVFSTFRPDPSAEQAIASVREQVDGVVVVDDGSGTASVDILDRIERIGAIVHRHGENRGIAAALNGGIRLARENGATAVVTFDQDSLVPDEFVPRLRVAHAAAEADGVRVGAVVPEHFADVRQARGGIGAYSPAVNVIQSGMLVPIDVVDKVGELRSDFFIDLVDTEFELRLRKAGYAVLAARGLRLGHSLGTRYRRELFGMPVRIPGIPQETTLSTPFRYFYRVRNRIVLNREYFWSSGGQIVRDSILDGIHFVNALWVARPRRSLWRLYRAGITAAVRGRGGRMPRALEPVAAQITWNAPVIEHLADPSSEGE